MQPITQITFSPSSATPEPTSLPAKLPQGNLQGRCCSLLHPIQTCTFGSLGCDLLLLIGGVVGAIITSNNSYISAGFGLAGTAGGIFTIKDSCSAYFLSAWRPKKSLEMAVESTTKAAQDVKQQIQTLSLQVQALETTKVQLERTLEEESTRRESLLQNLLQHEKKVEYLTKQMHELELSFHHISDVKKNFQKIAQTISTELIVFDQQIKQYAPLDIEKTTLLLPEPKTEFDIQQTQTFLDQINQAKTNWIEICKNLHLNFSSLREEIAQKTQQIQELQIIIQGLEQANNEIGTNMRTLTPMLEDLRQLTEQYNRAKIHFDQVQQLLQTFATLPPTATLSFVQSEAQKAINALRASQ